MRPGSNAWAGRRLDLLDTPKPALSAVFNLFTSAIATGF
jgi:hypothetical protein